MQEIKTLFPQDLYLKHLTVLGNIHFTSREIDVMSCIVNARRTSKIASFLSINPRTVETHIRNIMLKLECNSQEGIIDFIESSDKFSFFKKYYALLRMQIKFEKSLTLISKLNREKGPLYFFIQGEVKGAFVSHLADHLKLSGIRLSSTKRKKNRKPGGQLGRVGKNLRPFENPDEIIEVPVDLTKLPTGHVYKIVGFTARQVVEINLSRHIPITREELELGG